MSEGLEARAWVCIPGSQHSTDLRHICQEPSWRQWARCTDGHRSQKYRGEKKQTDVLNSSIYGSWTLSRHRYADTIRFTRRHTSEDKANSSEQVLLVEMEMKVGDGGRH